MLSPRLEAILAALAPCEVLADVGTHHGLVALAAQERGLAKLALGVDRPQPLDDARLNHEAQGSPAAVKLIAGLGLGPAGAYRPDAVVLAGMGARAAVPGEPSYREGGSAFGDAFLAKPFSPKTLAAKVREVLEGKPAERRDLAGHSF